MPPVDIDKQTLWWSVKEGMWLMREGLVLLWSMRFGLKWIWMTMKTLAFGIILWKTFLKLMWWYMNSPEIVRRVGYRKHSEKDPAGHKNNRAYLDLHYPVAVSDLIRSQGTQLSPPRNGKRRQQHLDNLSITMAGATMGTVQLKNLPPYPVIICVTGGAWIVGIHYWSAFIGRMMTNNGYLVVTPDYRNFPQGRMQDMVDDVTDSIAWTFRNIERFGGDTNRITIMGQSAGAHLIFLSIYQQIEAIGRGERPKYDPRRAYRLVGLSGIYDMEKLEPHFHSRGLPKRVFQMICNGDILKYSPLQRISALSDELFDKYFPHNISLIHGTADCSAPYQESEAMAAMLQRRQQRSKDESYLLRRPWEMKDMIEEQREEDDKKWQERLSSLQQPQPLGLRDTNSPANGLGSTPSMAGSCSLGSSPVGRSMNPPPTPQKATRLYLIPDATHTTPFVEDPVMQKSQVVEILMKEDSPYATPQFHLRPALASERAIGLASKVMPF